MSGKRAILVPPENKTYKFLFIVSEYMRGIRLVNKSLFDISESKLPQTTDIIGLSFCSQKIYFEITVV